jgi:hypothetical protein
VYKDRLAVSRCDADDRVERKHESCTAEPLRCVQCHVSGRRTEGCDEGKEGRKRDERTKRERRKQAITGSSIPR